MWLIGEFFYPCLVFSILGLIIKIFSPWGVGRIGGHGMVFVPDF